MDEAAPTTSPQPRPKPASPPTAAGSAGRGGAGQIRNAGRGDDSSGGGDPGVRADFAARVAAWLARHQHYPRTARLRRIEGTGTIWFRMNAAGRVTSARVTNSAGHPMLDSAMHETLRRAEPLPAIPPDLELGHMEFSVPIRFRLR